MDTETNVPRYTGSGLRGRRRKRIMYLKPPVIHGMAYEMFKHFRICFGISYDPHTPGVCSFIYHNRSVIRVGWGREYTENKQAAHNVH